MALPRPESRLESKKGISLLQPIYTTVSLHHMLDRLFSQKHIVESLGWGSSFRKDSGQRESQSPSLRRLTCGEQ